MAVALLAWMIVLGAPRSAHHAHEARSAVSSMAAAFADWTLMVAAMMLPLLASQVRLVSTRSLWYRRHRAVMLFVATYLAAWIVAGVVLVPLVWGANGSVWMQGAAVAAALLWHGSSVRRSALRGCHAAPHLAPSGAQADLACVKHGVTVAGWCVVSCAPLMIAAGHTRWAMAVVTVVLMLERHRPRHPQRLAVPLAGWRLGRV